MLVPQTLLWVLFTAVLSAPAIAQDLPLLAMRAGEIIAVMPDGKMARTALTDAAKIDEFKKIAERIPWCMMFMLGADGSVYRIDTSTHAPMVECENMVR